MAYRRRATRQNSAAPVAPVTLNAVEVIYVGVRKTRCERPSSRRTELEPYAEAQRLAKTLSARLRPNSKSSKLLILNKQLGETGPNRRRLCLRMTRASQVDLWAGRMSPETA